jgi:hypothetical protein
MSLWIISFYKVVSVRSYCSAQSDDACGEAVGGGGDGAAEGAGKVCARGELRLVTLELPPARTPPFSGSFPVSRYNRRKPTTIPHAVGSKTLAMSDHLSDALYCEPG